MTTPDTLVTFTQQWNQIMGFWQIPPESHLHPFAQIVAAYSEPHRYYHNLYHIVHMLDIVTFNYADELGRFRLQLATIFHDVVYDPRSSENEYRSAEVARRTLPELAVTDANIERVCELILMTKNHQAPERDGEAALLLDADLSVLGMAPVVYEGYAEAIRKEYAWVPDADFYQGRRKVLSGFLARRRIFQTAWGRQWEAQARANIAAEIAQIDARVKTLSA